MTVRRPYNIQVVLDSDLPCAEPTETIFINRIQARGIMRKIETSHPHGLMQHIWNGIWRHRPVTGPSMSPVIGPSMKDAEEVESLLTIENLPGPPPENP